MFMTVDIEKYKHLIFNGELPSGYELKPLYNDGLRYFFMAEGTVEDTLKKRYPIIVLLDNGLLVFSVGGYVAKSTALRVAERENKLYIGEGMVHSGIRAC